MLNIVIKSSLTLPIFTNKFKRKTSICANKSLIETNKVLFNIFLKFIGFSFEYINSMLRLLLLVLILFNLFSSVSAFLFFLFDLIFKIQ